MLSRIIPKPVRLFQSVSLLKPQFASVNRIGYASTPANTTTSTPATSVAPVTVKIPTSGDPKDITPDLLAATGIKSVMETPEAATRPTDSGPFLEVVHWAPTPDGITVQYVDTVAETKRTKSLEDEYCVWFGQNMPTVLDELKPERDRVNWPRPVQAIHPPPTRMFILPEHWFNFFYEKTGVTGPYLFGAGFITFLLSKELFVIDHDYPVGVSLIIIFYVFTKMYGKTMSQQLESAIWESYKSWYDYQHGSIKLLEDAVAYEKRFQMQQKSQSILFEAKRENVALQLEEEFRKRQMAAYNELKRKLDYQIAIQDSQKSYAQKHMVEWIIKNVSESITPDLEKTVLQKCVSDLKTLASKGIKI